MASCDELLKSLIEIAVKDGLNPVARNRMHEFMQKNLSEAIKLSGKTDTTPIKDKLKLQ